MTAACDKAFEIVEHVAKDTDSGTRGVDAFSLAWLRAERQIRRLLTNLVFQATAFDRKDMDTLKDALAKNPKNLYFRHFEAAPNALAGIPTSDVVDDYARLKGQMDLAWKRRNKLFHGLLTGDNLGTKDLLDLTADITTWCKNLSDGASERFGYDGFDGPCWGTSYWKRAGHKHYADIVSRVDKKLTDVPSYKTFLKGLA